MLAWKSHASNSVSLYPLYNPFFWNTKPVQELQNRLKYSWKQFQQATVSSRRSTKKQNQENVRTQNTKKIASKLRNASGSRIGNTCFNSSNLVNIKRRKRASCQCFAHVLAIPIAPFQGYHQLSEQRKDQITSKNFSTLFAVPKIPLDINQHFNLNSLHQIQVRYKMLASLFCMSTQNELYLEPSRT